MLIYRSSINPPTHTHTPTHIFASPFFLCDYFFVFAFSQFVLFLISFVPPRHLRLSILNRCAVVVFLQDYLCFMIYLSRECPRGTLLIVSAHSVTTSWCETFVLCFQTVLFLWVSAFLREVVTVLLCLISALCLVSR